MKHTRFEENILVDDSYADYGGKGKDRSDKKKSSGIAKNFAESLEQYDERKKWYNQLPQEPPITKTLTEQQIAELKKEANSALHGDTLAYENKSSKSGSSDQQWARTLLNKGTIGDRVAAATILIQDSPVHNLSALRNLIGSVKPAKKKDGIVVIDALSELFVSDLLIPETKLRRFELHALAHVDEMTSGNRRARTDALKLWIFEERLGELYAEYVEALNTYAHDSVDANKEKAVSAMSYLLMRHPEKEKILLKNVINKLGDPSQPVASKVIYHLCSLLYNHPNMKSVVLAEIERMLFRTNISPRAQYYGVCFLNQFHLGKDDSVIAESLIRIYFSFFKASIKKGEIDSRLMSAILTGVKRAYPFADKSRLTEPSRHVDAVQRIVHLGRFNVAVHALALLFQISDASDSIGDRYYTALYRKLTDARLFGSSHSALLFSLIYKSLRRDKSVSRVSAFVKRLLQLAARTSAAQACGLLLLLSQVTKDKEKRDAIKLVWAKEEIKEEIDLENDTMDTSEVKEQEDNEVKTDEQKEEEKKAEGLRMDLLKGSKKDLLDDDSDEEYQDLKIDEEGNIKPKIRRKAAGVAPGWFHVQLKSEPGKKKEEEEDKFKEKEIEAKIQLKKTINMDKVISSYNPYARNPTYAGAELSASAELLPLINHFHPSVRLFAQKILQGQIIQYGGDPLKDFAGVRFLERFVFKNPKRRPAEGAAGGEGGDEEGAVRSVRGSHPKFALRRNYVAKGLKSLSVTSASYLNEDAAKIPVDERFLYDYLRKKREAGEEATEADSDADSVTSEDFNQYLDRVTGTRPDEDSEEEGLDFMSEVQDTMKKRSVGKKAGAKDEDDSDGGDLDSEGGDEDDGELEISADEDAGALSGEEDELLLEGSDDEDQINVPGSGSGRKNLKAARGGDEDDGELEISADEDAGALSGEEDELLLEGSDDEDQINVPGSGSGRKNLKAARGKGDINSLFASAEEFSTLLEETAAIKKHGSSQAASTSDNANVKQLAWEDKRDHWIKGYNRKVHGARKPSDRSFAKGGKSFDKGNKGFAKGKGKGEFKGKKFDARKGGKRKGEGAGGAGGKRRKP